MRPSWGSKDGLIEDTDPPPTPWRFRMSHPQHRQIPGKRGQHTASTDSLECKLIVIRLLPTYHKRKGGPSRSSVHKYRLFYFTFSMNAWVRQAGTYFISHEHCQRGPLSEADLDFKKTNSKYFQTVRKECEKGSIFKDTYYAEL